MYTYIWGPKGSPWGQDQMGLKPMFVFLKHIGRPSIIRFQFSSVTFQIEISQSETFTSH